MNAEQKNMLKAFALAMEINQWLLDQYIEYQYVLGFVLSLLIHILPEVFWVWWLC